jgi:hypothetical protein
VDTASQADRRQLDEAATALGRSANADKPARSRGADNPFNPGFGVRPPVSAGRQTLVNEILARLGRGPGRHEFQTGAIASLKACLIARVSAESCGTTTSIDPGHT